MANATATLYNGEETPFNAILISTVGLAITRLLSLPVSTLSSSKIANQFVYVSSFRTTDVDWNIDTSKTSQSLIDEGNVKL